MATQVEELRNKLQAAIQARKEHVGKYGEDNLPDQAAESHLDALMNAEADLKAELGRVEKFEQARAFNGSAPSSANPAKADTSEQRRLITLGQRFVDDPNFKAFLSQVAPAGRILDGARVQSLPFPFKGLGELGMLASLITGDSSTSGGAFVTADRFAELQVLGRKPLSILDIIRRLQTGSDLVEYVAQTSRTNAAATVAEATSVSTGAKPESAAAFEVRSAPVRTIANWIPVTKQAVADVPQMRGIIDDELRDNLQEELADQVINGAGTGSDFTGIVNTSGTQTQAWDTNILTTTRKARTLVSTVGRRVPTAYVLNPSDWETIDLLQDNEARYFYGGPAQVGVPRLWGLPVVQEEAMTAGAALVGDFRRAILWDREQASISISDSHADFFVRNLLAILAELRAAFALVQPNAMVEIDVAA